MRLAGRVALITGGGRGIGRTIADALGREGAGVAIAARSADELEAAARELRAADATALAVRADVTERKDVEQMVARVEAELGPVDVLVNNAGVNLAFGPFWETDPDAWWRDVEINLRSIVLCTRTLLPGMLERGRGTIVNVNSNIGLQALPFTGAYAASKAAGVRFTDVLAAELAWLAREKGSDPGVRVFAASPGLVHTALADHLGGPEGMRRWLPGVKMAESSYRDPRLMADLVVRLAAGDADALSGRYLHVDMDLDSLIEAADGIRAADQLTLRFRGT